MDMFYKLTAELKKAVIQLEQVDLLADTDTKRSELLKRCEDVLKYSGYKVVNPFIDINVKEFKSNKELLILFNLYKAKYYGSSFIVSTGNKYIDEKHISNFVKSRQEINSCSASTARKECAMIISTIFENLDSFKFDRVCEPYMLGQKKCAWITQKAVDIIDKKYKEHLKREFNKLELAAKPYYSDEDFGLLGDY